VRLGVVAALRTELNPTLKALRTPEPYLFTTAGVGAEKAARAARALPQGLDGLLSVGFAGALTDDLAPGDLVLDGSGAPELLEPARRAGPHRVGRVEMVDHVVVGREEKEALARRTGALVVDMESAAVQAVARERGVNFLSVKVALDTPSCPLASTYDGCGTILVDILRRPWILARMIGDGRRARRAARRLRDFFLAFRKELTG
jgi:nucleoside phosphorylase